VSIRYGKNLTDLKQDENISNVYTGVYPFWTDFDGNLVQLPEKVVKATGTYAEDKIKPLNLSAEFSEKPTEDQLRNRARKYIVDNEIGIPNVSWTIYFVLLEQTDEYRGMDLLEQILLGDTVSVWFPKLGVNASARAVACRYKPSMSRYISITLGKVKSNIADTIAQQGQALADKPETTLIHSLMTQMTAAIVGARGGAVRLLDTDGDKYPDTLYIGDAPDPAQAKKVWRFNDEGWAVSKTGYNGPFVMAATIDKGIYADFITAGTLVGVLIKACRIESLNGKIAIDLSDESKMPVFNTGVSTNGLVVRGDAADAAEVFSLKAVKAAGGYFGKMLFKSVDGTDLFQLSESFTDGELSGIVAQFFARAGLSAVISTSEKRAGFWLRHDGEYKGYMIVDKDGSTSTSTARLNGKNLSWVSNGDGTYHLVGTNPT
jgi:hypothetical protein